MAKKKSNKIPLPIFILICAVLLFAMYLSLSTLTLAIWGDSVIGTVDSYQARLDDTDAGQNRSRTISKGYYFTVAGKEYQGYVIFASDEQWPRLSDGETRSERISYLSVFPYINKPSALCEFDEMGEAAIIYHILAPIGCLFLLVLVIRTFAGKGKKKTAARKRAEPKTIKTRSDTNMFCHNCGNKLPGGAVFCSSCGMKTQASAPGVCAACGATIPDGAEFCINCGTDVSAAATPAATESTVPSQATHYFPPQSSDIGSTGLVGFSERYNSSEILAAAQKNKKSSIGCMWILVFVPLIGFPVAGLLMDDFPFGESLVIGVGIAMIMLTVNLLALRKTKKPIWEGVVVNKYSKERSEHRGGDDDGKKKTIVEKDSGRNMYDYLAVGDRVRYHPKFGTYEKYNKSKDRIIYCNVCSMMNPIQNDRCKRCNNLLFK